MNPKRSETRQHFQRQNDAQVAKQQFETRTAHLSKLSKDQIEAIYTLIRFLDKKTTKTEVVNQLKSISTPDVDKVVKAVSKLDADVLANKLDIKPLENVMKQMLREVSLIPKSKVELPEQKESVKVTNLDEVKIDLEPVVKAVKELKLDPKIETKAPVVNVEQTDLKPVQDLLLDLLKAVQKQKPVEIPEFPETDLTKVEEKLDKANKQLKSLEEVFKNIKFPAGGGGGGNGTPYQTQSGQFSYVKLNNDGSIPISAATTEAISQAMYDAMVRLQPVQHDIPYARDLNDQMRVVVGGGTLTAVTQAWGNNATYASFYGTGGPNSVDAREQLMYQSETNFNLIRQQRWVIT